MFAFLFLLFPCAIVAWCMKEKKRDTVFTVIIGLMSAVVFCAFKFMFFFMHRVVPFSFFANFIYVFFSQVFFPAAIVFGAFCAISRDSVDFKMKSFFPLVASFYAVYLPFQIIGYSESNMSAYEIFAKPVLFLAYIAGVAFCIYKIFENRKRNLFIVLWAFFAIIIVLAPAAIEATWMIGMAWWKWVLPFALYVVIVAFFYSFTMLRARFFSKR